MEHPAIPNDFSNPQQGTIMTDTASTGATSETNNHYNYNNNKLPPTQYDPRKLFVGGLPANITAMEFHEFFQQFGPLIDSIVMVDRDSGRSRGFGFVTFESAQVAEQLLKSEVDGMPGRLTMQGKLCEVKPAQPREYGTKRFRGRRSSNATNGGGDGGTEYPLVDVPSSAPPFGAPEDGSDSPPIMPPPLPLPPMPYYPAGPMPTPPMMYGHPSAYVPFMMEGDGSQPPLPPQQAMYPLPYGFVPYVPMVQPPPTLQDQQQQGYNMPNQVMEEEGGEYCGQETDQKW